MKLYHHVQYLEQRMLMLENFCLQLALHLHHNGSTGRPAIPMYAKPHYRPPTPQPFRRDDIISDHARGDEGNRSSAAADFSSLADSLDGADETDVGGIGGFGDPSSESFGDDFGAGDADAAAASDAGDAGTSGDDGGSGAGDAGGMD